MREEIRFDYVTKYVPIIELNPGHRYAIGHVGESRGCRKEVILYNSYEDLEEAGENFILGRLANPNPDKIAIVTKEDTTSEWEESHPRRLLVLEERLIKDKEKMKSLSLGKGTAVGGN